jgi:hypothetical protein
VWNKSNATASLRSRTDQYSVPPADHYEVVMSRKWAQEIALDAKAPGPDGCNRRKDFDHLGRPSSPHCDARLVFMAVTNDFSFPLIANSSSSAEFAIVLARVNSRV